MATTSDVGAVFGLLGARYGPPTVGARDAFAVLVATILSHRTNDDRTHPAATRLLGAYPDAASLAGADIAEVRALIDGVGFPNQKAPALVACAAALVERHEGRVPRDEAALLALPHVGRKTMNCVLVYGFAAPVVAVDTHVHRIANRLGWCATRTPEETERALDSLLTDDQKLAVNEYLVRLGRELCRPVGPKCGDCPLRATCPSAGPRGPEGIDHVEGPTMLARIAQGA